MEYKVLANGVDGLFVENKRFNTTLVSFNFYLPLSNDNLSANALLPYVLTSCSEKYESFTQLNTALNMLYGADLSVAVNKIGDAQVIKMSIAVINDEYSMTNEPIIDKATELLMELIFNPKLIGNEFYADDTEREKRKVREHILGEINDKRRYARKRLIEEMFSGYTYAHSVYGTVDSLEIVTGKELYSAWCNLLRCAYVRVQLVGKRLPSGFFEKISEKFSVNDRVVSDDYRNISHLDSCDKVKYVNDTMAVSQGKLVMGFTSDLWGKDAYALTVASDIFGGGTYSGLFANVREKLSLCYYCSASANRNKGYLVVDSGVEFDKAKKAEEEILNQLQMVKNGEFDQFTFEASIKNINNMLLSSYDSLGALENWYASHIFTRKVESPEEVAKIISMVTREEVIEAANGIKLHTVYNLTGEQEGE